MSYLFPVPAQPLRSLLDGKARTGEVFTDDEATLDLMLMMDRDDVKPIRYMAQRWKWPRTSLSRKLEDMKRRAEGWRAFDLGQVGPPVGQTGTKSGQNDSEIADVGPQVGQVGPPVGQYSTELHNSELDISKNKPSDNQQAQHARKRASRPGFTPPSESEVLNTFTERLTRSPGLFDPAIEAERFMAYYESNGWRVGRNPMKSWGAAITNWITNIKDRNGHTQRKARNDSRDADARANVSGGGSENGRADAYDWDSFYERGPRMAVNAGADGNAAPVQSGTPPHMSLVR